MWLLNRNRKPSEEQTIIAEFQGWMNQANHLSRDKFKTTDEKRAALSDHLDTLSVEAFTEYFPIIMGIIQSKRAGCEPFEDTEAQVDNICSWLKRMNDNRELLTIFIRERRENYGLEV